MRDESGSSSPVDLPAEADGKNTVGQDGQRAAPGHDALLWLAQVAYPRLSDGITVRVPRWVIDAARQTVTPPAAHERKPRLLDLFCGAGGAAKGYADAGFEVIGVDIAPQPNYPYRFVQADAVAFLRPLVTPSPLLYGGGHVGGFDAIHASPPCQRYSGMTNCRPGVADDYPDLVAEVRTLMQASGVPYVIENVPGAPLRDPVMLCGFMFGRELYRHRLFETSWPLRQPEHPEHVIPASKAGHWRPGTVMSVAGHVAPIAKAREVMEMGWTTREEMAEAIPPYYAEYVGQQLLSVVMKRRAVA